ncbi:ArsR/SmtB family transcription factor [Natrialbaceae archaeon A-gly3]
MARLFPLRSETETAEGQPRVVDLEGEDADAVFSALSSATAREIYSRLSDEPGTPSDVAEAIDSSIQNVRYHLENLEDAGLVEVVDTWYSSRGNEMSVYATTDGPLIVTSDESRASRLKDALSRFLGGIAALAGGSLLVQHAAGEYFSPAGDVEYVRTDDGDGVVDDDDTGTVTDDEPAEEEPADDAAGIQQEPEDAPEEDADAPEEDEEVDTAVDDADAADDVSVTGDDVSVTGDEVGIVDSPEVLETATTLPPGLLFFLGGAFVLTIVVIYWYWSAGRPA